ncbi:MAG TPA: nucleotidyl transferase AbiEii/AbiGii toxin family protein [Clostridiales bacterium]|jgi:predicted nucleotidyltransferase component of viral defense system|nr:MAG: hypothetical protein BWY37_00933 [Firmicutes bacterium ADurb.Bin262]HOU11115.1 nucleotidyl transferase AbiEii/AbiGii toxin family protein [Clostridiales bacterium]HQH62396.1 nucleotidyl transferase AbiEii/AbiGii toxin family protein [Clostridiales bacterium]HQK73719.1 nucleotidyl transferase AbiEii/AbiGii toxin family protein [Clostridiales bacterium]
MNNADSVKARLKNLAVKECKPYDYILIHYCIERLLYRLSSSRYADNFILKGGLLLYTILDNHQARATKDIDFLARQIDNTPEELSRIFIEISMIPSDDALRFDSKSISVERIIENADYQGVRIKLTVYLDKSRCVLQLDIGFGDIIVPKPVDMDYPSLLDMSQPHLKAYSLESVIAEKFQAMLYLAESNSRMKDFYDIYTLCRSFDFDGYTLFSAISQTIKRRQTPLNQIPTIFSAAFPDQKEKQGQWRTFRKRIGVIDNVEFAEVIASINSFLHPLYNGILSGSSFTGKWDHVKGEWIPITHPNQKMN